MKSPKDIAVLVLMFVIAIGAVGGSIYAYVYIQKGQKSADDILNNAQEAVKREPVDKFTADLIRARSVLFTEGKRLQEMKSILASLYSPENVVTDAYYAANNAVTNNADTLFKNATSTKPEIKVALATQIRNEINTKRADLTKTLKAWKALADSGSTGQAAVTAAQGYAEDVQNYLNDLQNIVNNLTPGNSGLSQAEIDAYEQAINDAIIASQDITGSNTGSTGSTNNPSDPSTPSNPSNPSDNNSTTQPPVVTPETVDEQEEVVEEAEEVVDNLENQGNATTTPPTTTNPDPNVNIPPPTTSSGDTSGKPKLVEGANPIP